MTYLGVVIPVGPEEHHARWLGECLDSMAAQVRPPDHIVIVDDMHGLKASETCAPVGVRSIEVWDAPWRLGVPHAFNIGLARAFAAGCDLTLMMGADDVLSPDALSSLLATFEHQHGRDGYYWQDVWYSTGEQQRLPCNAAAVTPGLWRQTGGFIPESAVGGCDATFVSMMLVHHPDMLFHVEGGHLWHRVHPDQETARQGGLNSARELTRDWHTANFRPPTWGRFQ